MTESEGEIVGEFISEYQWEETKALLAALRRMEPYFKQWVKESIIELIKEGKIAIDGQPSVEGEPTYIDIEKPKEGGE